VYAPSHDITISGSGDLYGAIVANSIASSGGSKVHYDEALSNARSTIITIVRGAWTELTQF
jgi:hypothetical protein